jgi:hypothetical protein
VSAATLRYGTPAAVGQGVFTAATAAAAVGTREEEERYREEVFNSVIARCSVGIFVSFSVTLFQVFFASRHCVLCFCITKITYLQLLKE